MTTEPTIEIETDRISVGISRHFNVIFRPGLEVTDKHGTRLLVVSASVIFRWDPWKGEWKGIDSARVARRQMKKDGTWGVEVNRDLYSFSDREVLERVKAAVTHLKPTEPPTVYAEK